MQNGDWPTTLLSVHGSPLTTICCPPPTVCLSCTHTNALTTSREMGTGGQEDEARQGRIGGGGSVDGGGGQIAWGLDLSWPQTKATIVPVYIPFAHLSSNVKYCHTMARVFSLKCSGGQAVVSLHFSRVDLYTQFQELLHMGETGTKYDYAF